MKGEILVWGVFLLTALSHMSIQVSAADSEENLRVTPGLPEDVPREPMSENSTAEDYLNTTNPHTRGDSFEEVDEVEGDQPLYVLVFADEEERQITREAPQGSAFTWDEWITMQLERGDESLAANFGIDIRILDRRTWDSNDSLTTTEDLWRELEEDTQHYFGWYDGLYWSNYVDVIIGITAQTTTDNTAGLASPRYAMDQGRIFIILKWQVYWADDNLVQHEISHLFYPDDRENPCGIMASHHVHFQTFIWEDKLWAVFNDIQCAYTSYSWSTIPSNLIETYRDLYAYLDSDYLLVVRHWEPDDPRGGLSHDPGIYVYNNLTTVTISVTSAKYGYEFDYWLIDGQQKISNKSITITVYSKQYVAARFTPKERRGGGGGGSSVSSRNVYY